MQRRNTNTVICLITVLIVLVASAVVIILLQDDTSSNSTLLTDSSSSSGSVIFSNSSVLEHNTPIIAYPWTLLGDSNNKTDDTTNDETISDYHDGPNSDFISITDIARDITPIKSTRSSNKCTDNNKSLMRFTLITDNYPVRFVCSLVCVHMMCSYAMCSFC